MQLKFNAWGSGGPNSGGRSPAASASIGDFTRNTKIMKTKQSNEIDV
jgi:hypothetical protein